MLGRFASGNRFSDWIEEGSKRGVEVLARDAKIPVEEEEELFLHEIDLLESEKTHSVGLPVLVLRRRVVEVLGTEDESGEEDPVAGARHTLGYRRQLVPKTVKVDHG